jgi:hypothetical protein
VEQREGGFDIHEVNNKQEKVLGKRDKRRHIQVYVDEAKKQSAKLKRQGRVDVLPLSLGHLVVGFCTERAVSG